MTAEAAIQFALEAISENTLPPKWKQGPRILFQLQGLELKSRVPIAQVSESGKCYDHLHCFTVKDLRLKMFTGHQ